MLIRRARECICYKSESKIGVRTRTGSAKGGRDKRELAEKIASYEDLFGSLKPENYEDGIYTIKGLTDETMSMLRSYQRALHPWYGDLRIHAGEHTVEISDRAILDLRNSYLLTHEDHRRRRG